MVDALERRRIGLPFGAKLRSRMRGLRRLLALAALIVIAAFFSVASPVFLSFDNVVSVLLSTVVVGTLAVGTTFVIITAGIDLSLGTGMALTAVMAGVFLVEWHWPLALGLVATLLVGALIGVANGISVAILKMPPFIATLAMMLVAGGLALVISNSTPIYFTNVAGFGDIALGNIIPGLNIPNAIPIFLVICIILSLILNHTILGRYTFAIGSNIEATRLSGVRVNKWLVIIYAFAGLFIGAAGILVSARLGSAQPAIGMGYELQAIAAVVIGGTSLFGGVGSISGTVIGALIMSTLNNGLRIIAVPQQWQNVALGLVVLAAVYVDNLRREIDMK